MKPFYLFFFLSTWTFLLPGSAHDKKPVFVHYMPWFEAKPFGPRWGSHWKGGPFNPDVVDEKGFRSIASHHYPLLGPYDSNDPKVIDCHLQWMKMAGIDGVIVDWYGIENHLDYPMIHRNTQHLFQKVTKAGLKFIICYEDQTFNKVLEKNILAPKDVLPTGQRVMQWMDQNWFSHPSYFKLNQHPVLLVFGPQHLKQYQWQAMTRDLNHPPHIYGLPHLSKKGSGMFGQYLWAPASKGKNITKADWISYLIDHYIEGEQGTPTLAVAFPGFHDIYAETQKEKSFGFIDHENGKTLTDSLYLALNSQTPLVQLCTWNDFGEGTSVEPTYEHGFHYLEIIQSMIKNQGETKYTVLHFELPLNIYRLLLNHNLNEKQLKSIHHIRDLIYALDITSAQKHWKSFLEHNPKFQ